MNKRFGSIVLDTAFRYMVPFLLLYAVYVLVHGEYSPGGGFQAGTLLALAVVVTRLIQGEEALFNISGDRAIILAAVGTMIYVGVGLFAMAGGGNFLEYGALPLGLTETALHPLGILGIEIGVTLCVMAVIIAIFDALIRRDDAV